MVGHVATTVDENHNIISISPCLHATTLSFVQLLLLQRQCFNNNIIMIIIIVHQTLSDLIHFHNTYIVIALIT